MDIQTLLEKYKVPDYEDLFAYENSVICSSKEFTPCPVQLEDRTLLGCLNGQIQSIDRNELVSILGDSYINDMFRKIKKAEAPTFRGVVFEVRPSVRPENPVRGTLIFNDLTSRMEFFNGEKWESL